MNDLGKVVQELLEAQGWDLVATLPLKEAEVFADLIDMGLHPEYVRAMLGKVILPDGEASEDEYAVYARQPESLSDMRSSLDMN